MPEERSTPRPVCPRCGASVPEGEPLCPVCEGPTELWTPSHAGRAAAASRSPSAPSASRFAPGTMLADRYRIVSRLGSGGMGEVYRAEDLRLGQAVALKFLPRELGREAGRRDLLFREVRLGRQVSHPNVCRLYDVVEWEGHLFVAMEYVDGEDLASLIRRIGALPEGKVVELAREMASGLAAAHGLGVIHRDLKPANVMIDGRGRARITDFGLAVVAGEAEGASEMAGTPVYMAPEQLRGEAATHRSDLYALGLVLYEMATGERRFEPGTVPELLSRHERSSPDALSGRLTALDPALSRVIERCLRESPEERPPSIHGVLAALPGGDPLQAAVDAGETPSPELVAAAEGPGTLSPGIAGGLFALVAAITIWSAATAPTWQVPGVFPVPESPQVLAAEARELLRGLGIQPERGTQVYHFDFDWDIRLWLEEDIGGPDPWKGVADLAPSPAQLWYRYAPPGVLLSSRRDHEEVVTPEDPALNEPGMALVRLDALGRLLEVTVVPPQRPRDVEARALDWSALLEATGLELSTLVETAPEWVPPVGSTERRAWTGRYPGQPDVPIRIEAAAAAGAAVWIRVLPPWTRPAEVSVVHVERWERSDRVLEVLLSLMTLALIAVAVWFARRNSRQGRGDRRGAARLGLVVAGAWLVERLLGADLLPAIFLGQMLSLLMLPAALGLATWLLYLALEPYLRRTWPRLLVGWHRLVSGRWRDARVGREVLLGLGLGSFYLLALAPLASIAGVPNTPWSPPLGLLDRFRDLFQVLAGILGGALVVALMWALVLLVFTLLFRRRSFGVAGLGIVMLLVGTGWEIFDLRYFIIIKVVFALVMTFALARFGLLTLAAALVACDVLESLPVTLDPTAWYFPHALVPIVTVLGLAAWAAWRSLGERTGLAALLGEGPGVTLDR